MARLIVILIFIAALSVGLTFLIYRFTKESKGIKYLPGLTSALMAAYFIFFMKAPSEGFQDLGRMIMAVMFIVWAVAGTACAAIIDARTKNRRE